LLPNFVIGYPHTTNFDLSSFVLRLSLLQTRNDESPLGFADILRSFPNLEGIFILRFAVGVSLCPEFDLYEYVYVLLKPWLAMALMTSANGLH
jgi:hypothetical protein